MSSADQLSDTQQAIAVDIAAAASLLVTRLPDLPPEFFDKLITEYAAQYNVPSTLARMAIRHLGRLLAETPWELLITKDRDGYVVTHYTPGASAVVTGQN